VSGPRRWAALPLLCGLAACTLAEVVTPDAADVLVVEAVLRPDQSMQRILLHSSLSEAGTGTEQGARVVVRSDEGYEVVFQQTSQTELCLSSPAPANTACYVSDERQGPWVMPGREYELSVSSRDGRRAFARTRVPGRFRLLQPAVRSWPPCSLPPGTPLPLVWSSSEGAWTYIAEMEIEGLRGALADQIPGEIPDRISLTGISISEADTTMLFPGDFGIFERTQFEQPLLLALRDGLPAGVTARVVLAAADRNYVNGVRGGTFNPSGRVRIPSVAGDATGVFGSVFTQTLLVDVSPVNRFRPCLNP
jgi:hypothetical protein